MNEELKIIIKAVTDSAQKAIKGVKDELQGMSKTAQGISGKIGAVFKGIAKGAAIVVGAIAAIIGALVALGKNTLDTQKQFAKLNTAFQSAGMSAQQASQTYSDMYRFLGESDRAVEAANHLTKITTSQQNLAEWTKICQGVYATFGDSLPIEGLTESANETLRVGKVTGNLADALNWAGVSEDEFNAKLATTNSLEEREVLLRNTLNDLYSNAADIYERNNGALLAYNESQAKLDGIMAQAGAATLPLLTALNNLGSAFFTALKPAIDAIVPPLTTFINWIAKAIQSVTAFFSALTGKSTTVKAIGDIGSAAVGAAQDLGNAAQGAKNLGSGMGGAEKAAGGAAKAIEDAKKSTQGFDELNIVPSDKKADSGGSSSGGSGGGGGSSAPGYSGGSGLIDTASFSTEVEESESLADGLFENIKGTFEKLAEVFSPSIDAWSGAFETVRQAWNNAKPDFISGAEQIKEGFVTLGSYLLNDFVPTVVNSFSVNFAPIVGDTLGFVIEELGRTFEWLGGYVNTAVNDIIIPGLESVKTVATDVFSIIGSAWSEHGEGLLSSFGEFFGNLRGHFDGFYSKTVKPVWDNILKVFDRVWKEGLKPLVDRFVNACASIGQDLLDLYNKVIAPIVDWIMQNIMPIIVEVVNKVVEIVGNIVIKISGFVEGIIQVIQGIISFVVGVFTGDWEKAWEGVKNIFSGLWDAIKAIIGVVIEVLTGIATCIVEVVAAAFKIAWEAIKLVWEQVVKFFQTVWDGIVKVFSVVVAWFKEQFEKAWTAIKDIWNAVIDWFQGVWDGIVNVFSVVGTWFKEQFNLAWTNIKNVWNTVTSWFQGVWDGITNVFSGVGNWFQDIFSTAWTNIKNVFSSWGEFFSGLWDTIKSTFSSLGTSLGDAIGGAVKAGINSVISLIENTINGAINLINGAIRIINKLPGVNIGSISRLSLPRLAKGGIIDKATIAMVGEAGKEAVVPLEHNTEWMDKLAEKLNTKTPTRVILQVGEKELGWATIGAINGITEQTGGLQLVL